MLPDSIIKDIIVIKTSTQVLSNFSLLSLGFVSVDFTAQQHDSILQYINVINMTVSCVFIMSAKYKHMYTDKFFYIEKYTESQNYTRKKLQFLVVDIIKIFVKYGYIFYL